MLALQEKFNEFEMVHVAGIYHHFLNFELWVLQLQLFEEPIKRI